MKLLCFYDIMFSFSCAKLHMISCYCKFIKLMRYENGTKYLHQIEYCQTLHTLIHIYIYVCLFGRILLEH